MTNNIKNGAEKLNHGLNKVERQLQNLTCLSKMSDFPLSSDFVCVCLRKE